jgi:uncharacterized protein
LALGVAKDRPHVTGHFYRSSAGAEVWAIEVKRGLSPKVERGFHSACADLKPTRKWVLYPGSEVFPLGSDILAMPLLAACAALASLAR